MTLASIGSAALINGDTMEFMLLDGVRHPGTSGNYFACLTATILILR